MTSHLYIPLIRTNGKSGEEPPAPPAPPPAPPPQPETPSWKWPVGLLEPEKEVLTLAIFNAEQRRQQITVDPILCMVARQRAEDMALRNYFSHQTPEGHYPNFLVKRAGFPLPDYYPVDRNSVESIAGGKEKAVDTWQQWMDSPSHRQHVLGLIDFWANQRWIGVGYAHRPNSPYLWYWVFLSAEKKP